jgi:hypothetical protein
MCQSNIDGTPRQRPVLFIDTAVCPSVVFILALSTTRSFGCELFTDLVLERVVGRGVTHDFSCLKFTIGGEAGIIERDAHVGIHPWLSSMCLLVTTMLTCLVVLLASCADGKDATGEWHVYMVGKARRSEEQV